jgi:hypothetical protein
MYNTGKKGRERAAYRRVFVSRGEDVGGGMKDTVGIRDVVGRSEGG